MVDYFLPVHSVVQWVWSVPVTIEFNSDSARFWLTR